MIVSMAAREANQLEKSLACIFEPYQGPALEIGGVLEQDVFDQYGLLLACRGESVTAELVRQHQRRSLCTVYRHESGIRWLYGDAALLDAGTLMKVTRLMGNMLREVQESETLNQYLVGLRSYDYPTYLHSLNVGMLVLVIGMALGFRSERLQKLALAGLLHDVGKLKVDRLLLNKIGTLTAKEYETVKQHVLASGDMLKGLVEKEVLQTILQHHERQNGSGYPGGLAGMQIREDSCILAVADVFDAVAANRPYRKGLPPHHALEVLLRGCGSDFSPAIVQAFAQSIRLYPEQCLVTLNTGEVGRVLSVSTQHPTRPLLGLFTDAAGHVLEAPQTVDLAHQSARYITAVNYGGDVQMNIMLIDDDQDCMLGLASAIEPTGFLCDLFTSPEKAVQQYGTGSYEVVITDMKMPGMNGIQVLKAIKARNREAKVILITGYGDVDTAIAAVNNGAYAFFCKPVNIEELLETIGQISEEVGRKQREKEEQDKMAAEYLRLKKAYLEIQAVLEKQDAGSGSE